MLDLRSSPFTDHAKDKIRTVVNHLYQLRGIEISGGPVVDAQGAPYLSVHIIQRQIVHGKILSADELISKGADLFDGLLCDGFKLQISVTPYKK